MYSHDELFRLVKAHIKENYNKDIYDADKAGDKARSYSEEEAKILAKQLVTDLEIAFVAIQKHKGMETDMFFSNSPRVTYNIKKNSSKGFIIHVNFPAKYLFRPSLIVAYTKNKKQRRRFGALGSPFGRTGEGINDIFALFTTGYSTSKRMPAGYWVSNDRQTEVGDGIVIAPNYFPASSFIRDTIEIFEKEHPGIYVEYPEEWH